MARLLAPVLSPWRPVVPRFGDPLVRDPLEVDGRCGRFALGYGRVRGGAALSRAARRQDIGGRAGKRRDDGTHPLC